MPKDYDGRVAPIVADLQSLVYQFCTYASSLPAGNTAIGARPIILIFSSIVTGQNRI